MKVTYGFGKVRTSRKKSVVVIGVFDGVHKGHQALINKAVGKAVRLKVPTVVLTFDPHPVHVLHPERNLSLIAPLAYRLKLIEELGVGETVVVQFTKSFARLTPLKFIENYLIKYIHPREVFVGDDFRFGQDRSGSIDDFMSAGRRLGFNVNHIKPVKGDATKISSSDIRELIGKGDLKKAAFLLGRPVSVMGRVVYGSSRGKALGFPTANIIPQNEIIPPHGVYAVRVFYKNKILKGVANIGTRPTFQDSSQLFIETHIFGFNESLYGREIIIEFLSKIRDERRFDSSRQLASQIKKDISQAQKIHSHQPFN